MIHGPTVLVEIGFDPVFEEGDDDRPNIPDDLLPALVDTGATESCVDAALARELNMPLVGRRIVAGIGGGTPVDYFLGQIYVAGLGQTIYGHLAGAHLRTGGQPCYALIGRTFLQHLTLHYEGRTGNVTLSND